MQDYLPLELWEEVLFLLPPEGVARASLVGKAVSNEIWSLYRHADLRKLRGTDSIPPGDLAARVYSWTVGRILQATSPASMRSLSLSSVYLLTSEVTGSLFSLVAQRTALTSLDLGTNCTNSLDDSAAVVSILKTLPHLRSVAIAPLRDGWKFFTQLQSLKSLTLQYPARLEGWTVPQITNLHFINSSKLRASTTDQFFRGCVNVSSIEFTAISVGMFSPFVIVAIKMLPRLRKIALTNCEFGDNMFLEEIASEHFSSLESLEIRDYTKRGYILDESFTTFCTMASQNLKQLTKLVFPTQLQINTDSMSKLCCLQNLAVLDTEGWETDESVLDSWISSPLFDSLQRLNLRRCHKISLGFVEALLSRARHLVEIDISFTDATKSVKEISKLQKQYPNVLIHI